MPTVAAKLASEHIKDILVTDGFAFGGTGDWHVWIGKQPSTPDRAITIYDSGGTAANPRWLINYPSVQIRVRGGQNDYQLAGQKAREVFDRLIGRDSFTTPSGDRIVSITAIGDVAFTGFDTDTIRPEFVFNFRMIIEPTASTSPTNREPL